MEHPSIWIGYAPREPEAFAVCRYSLRRRTSRQIPIGGVHLAQMRTDGLMTREDGAEHAARFFTPFLAGWKGWALFVDGNMIGLRDVARLFDLFDDRYALMCVKGARQSTLMAFNCSHPAHTSLAAEDINDQPLDWLDGLRWLPDRLIGTFPQDWCFVPGETEQQYAASMVLLTDESRTTGEFSKEWARIRREWISGDMA